MYRWKGYNGARIRGVEARSKRVGNVVVRIKGGGGVGRSKRLAKVPVGRGISRFYIVTWACSAALALGLHNVT